MNSITTIFKKFCRLIASSTALFALSCLIMTTSQAKLIVINGDAECVTTNDGNTYCISKDLKTIKESTRIYGQGDSIGQKGTPQIVKK